MRRLAHFSRPLNALFALWFAMVLGDPGVLHSCPMHGAHGAAQAASTSATSTAHGEHAEHAMSAAAADSPGTGHHESSPAPCTCVGHCCAAAAVAPVSPVATVVVPDVVVTIRRPPAPPASDHPASPDVRLPFANGPPTA